jgi:hypothetical protein
MKTNQDIAQEILMGMWGNGAERRERLTKAGYNYDNVQSIVNALVYGHELPVIEEAPQPQEQKPQGKQPLEIDYDMSKNDGIIVNIII